MIIKEDAPTEAIVMPIPTTDPILTPVPTPNPPAGHTIYIPLIARP